MADDAQHNARVESVVVFDPDPRGLYLVAALTRRALRDFGRRAVIDARGSGDFHGLAGSPQSFSGLAGRVGGSARAYVSRTSQLTSERSKDNAAAMDAFYEQLQRRGA